ncbi:LysR family transcriptional regulator [Aureimonas jatrophae]|uniref:DNA-binding transcriptional regulator, LysR family n=1 Tax=Aureimonas jatrophae TaxID=1166073 RepID=A0A1H0JBU6_9HYPH|nr:LysR family transcriptional regulator [Aureimonas jatrophae]MBB3951485.1 DNA-binding transcriptional LysR family regulator [Aureimonas jatrophae]SDO41217.1 DNA-binding transcriptional regulator, LysR family [Aureimonas jatrophae]
MTLDQLRIFVAVAERSHVTEAARALNLTQSATSSALAALETRHGVRLFDRVGRGIELTEAGRLFLPEARAVLARAAEAACALDDLTNLRRGHVALVASQTVANHWLPSHMRRFRERHPGVTLSLRIANTRQAGEAVAAGDVDLGFVEDELGDPRLRLTRVAHDRLILVASSDHGSTEAGLQRVSDLARATWIMREPGSGTRNILEDALRVGGIDPTTLSVELELPSNEAVRAAIEVGGVVGVLPLAVAQPGLASGALVEIGFPLPSRGFHAVEMKDRSLGRAASAFLHEVHDGDPGPSA